MNELNQTAERIKQICLKEGWDKNWSKGGCYIHLETSEFIESLRGKGDSTPTEEAADVIIALFAVLANYNIKPSDVMIAVNNTLNEFEGKTNNE